MNRFTATRIAALALALTSLAGCATDGRTSLGKDDLNANCYTVGNRICGGTQADEDIAWQVWDGADGPRKLKVDDSRGFRVDYVGTATTYPDLMEYDLALPWKDGKWYVFRAGYTS